jgi:hypothetical protein
MGSVPTCSADLETYFLGDLLHVSHDLVVALWVEQYGKTPGVLESDQVGFLRVIVQVDCPECPDLLARHLRTVDALLQRRWEQRRPHQKHASVSPCLELSHDAVDDVRFGREDVDGVHVALRLAAVLDLLDVGDVGVEDVVFLDDVVYELLRVLVEDEDLPLRLCQRMVMGWIGSAHVAADHLADGGENHCITCQPAPQTVCAQCAWTYALAGPRSWTPSWRGAAAGAGRMQRGGVEDGGGELQAQWRCCEVEGGRRAEQCGRLHARR